MYRPPAFIKRAEIEEAIQDVQEMAGPDVVRIRHEIVRTGAGSGPSSSASSVPRTPRGAAYGSCPERRSGTCATQMGVCSYHNFRSERAGGFAGTGMGPADELLEDACHLAAKGSTERRVSCMRRAVSTAYYSVFHLLVADFAGNGPFADQRARLARMFNHSRIIEATFTPLAAAIHRGTEAA